MNEIEEPARSVIMTLRLLFEGIPGRLIGDSAGNRASVVNSVQDDSRKIKPGDVFVAVRGRQVDGHDFVAVAVARGASAVVVEREFPGLAVPQLIVENAAVALGTLVGRSMGRPAEHLSLIGITGTNGKTTTSFVVESILAAAAVPAGVIGTVSYRWAGHIVDAPYTTPTPAVLHGTLAKMRGDGVTHVVMETSSAALAMHRLSGVQFACAAFSNLTQDHLDLHGTMERYREAKQLLFRDHVRTGIAVINIDDPEGDGMVAACVGARGVLRVSAQTATADSQTTLRPSQQAAEIKVVWCESTVRGVRARIQTPSGELAVENRALVGSYNVANLALAVGIAEGLGIAHSAIAAGIANLSGVPGRVERVNNRADLDILVDYAHTPDALRNVLGALRPLTARRLICVFGCGGDRDPGKRPQMGAAVAELADLVVITSDNPRTEDPISILEMIRPAVPAPFFVHVDRRIAIRAAIAEAGPGDVVVIAGKGHEDYQILGTTKIHFDDREEAAAAALLRPIWSIEEVAAISGGTIANLGPPVEVCGVVIDSRRVTPGQLFVAIRGEHHDGAQFWPAAKQAGAAALLASAAIPGEPVVVVPDPTLALGQLAAAHRRWWRQTNPSARLIAITGSSGKTTTKHLTASALGAAALTHAAVGSLNNETGLPLSVLGLRAHHRYGVVEMGMRGLGQIEYLTRLAQPDVAVVVNAGVAHLELLGSREAIVQAKGEIWIGLSDDGVVVRPADDERLARWAHQHAPRARTLLVGAGSSGHHADIALLDYRIEAPGARLKVRALDKIHEFLLPQPGRHVAFDACCAIAAAIAVEVEVETALAGLSTSRPAAMRGELVEVAGRHVVVDCYNANPASMAAALEMMGELADGRQVVAVLGDMLELGPDSAAEHASLIASAINAGFRLIAVGALTGAAAAPHGAAAIAVSDPDAAATRALAWSAPGDFILLKASRGMRLERVLEAMQKADG
jgi:MurE/MurF fusion protein